MVYCGLLWFNDGLMMKNGEYDPFTTFWLVFIWELYGWYRINLAINHQNGLNMQNAKHSSILIGLL